MKRMIPNGFGGPGVSMGMVEVEDEAPAGLATTYTFPPPTDWRAIADRLAATLANLQREAREAEDGGDFTRDVIEAKWPALAEYDRAVAPPPKPAPTATATGEDAT